MTSYIGEPAEPATAVPSPKRAWAIAGALAGLLGVIGIQVSGTIDAAYDTDRAGDATAIMSALAEQRTALIVEHVLLSLSALLLLVFAAGLYRHLVDRLPDGSMLPALAAFGMVATTAVVLVGTGLTTEIVFGLARPEELVPEFAVVAAHWVGTLPWVWAATGVSALAVAVATLRHHAEAAWLGWLSAALGVLTAGLGISPLQYLAGLTGPLWVLVTGVTLAVTRDR
ncbi:hypothetical protein OG921_02800 [Aldersonia sp. NBC_00410]|uniref:hypothetical protein n=1 Tax=Aldersonia sp. NBC_00410 TaxID=2975954 RepID=UPI002256DF97|nr:hypothetical protein [Aldersonia sp. NBC_00410]MCX5042122.1 hypothetical protein [Aldersonia sp. NBC_00410]